MPVAIKIKRFETAGDVPNTSELLDGEIAVNIADKKIYVRDGSTIVEMTADLSSVAEDIIPDGNGTRSLGTAAKRWKDLFLSGDTINLGGATISSDGTGTVSVSATGVTLPDDSKTAAGNKLAVQGSGITGQVIKKVPFFIAGNLSTVNKLFEFNATIDNRRTFDEVHGFTLEDGNSNANSEITLFQF